jgi:hypothetical protein
VTLLPRTRTPPQEQDQIRFEALVRILDNPTPTDLHLDKRWPGVSRTLNQLDNYTGTSQAELDRIMGAGGLISDAVERWRRHAPGVPTIVFFVSIAHSEAICRRFRQAGARHVDGDTPDEELPGRLVPVAHDRQLMTRLKTYRYREALRWAGDDPWKIHQVAVPRGYKPGSYAGIWVTR